MLTVAAVVRSGAIPVLADCDDSFNMDPAAAERSITKRTKAILTVHMAGVMGHITELVQVARRHKLTLIEDCAQAAGISQNGRKAGSFGDIAVFSFQMNKHMTTGEGGMVVTSNRRLYRRAAAIHDLGYPREEGDLATREGDEAVQLWGIGVRMSELTAAVGRVQLSKLDKICTCMRTAKYRIRAALAEFGRIRLREVIDPAGDGGSFLYLTFPAREESLTVARAMTAEGVPVKPLDTFGMHIYYNVPSLVKKLGISNKSVWDLVENKDSRVSYDKGTCPHLDDLINRTLYMNIPSGLITEDVADICLAFRKVCTQVLEDGRPC